MKKILLLSTLFFVGLAVQAQNSVVVQVENIKNSKGVCRAYLFDRSEYFPSDIAKALASKDVEVTGSKTSLTFENVPAGTYAISVIHDENNNNRLDTNFLGIPEEGYGASKNQLPKMSKPDFTENAFRVSNKSVRILVQIMY